MATELQLDVAIGTANSAKSLRELGKGLRDLVALQGQVAEGSADFRKLQDAINKTEGRVGDLNDSFNTLRGSGVERVNSSLSLFRDGLANADVGKLTTALDGLSGAMKAIPIFLVIEGVKLLFDNWGKLTAIFSESAKEAKRNEDALRLLTIQIDSQSTAIDRNIILQEQQLKLLKDQDAPLSSVLSKIKEINDLKTSKLNGELKKTDKEISNILSKLQAAKSDRASQTETESFLQFLGFSAGTSEEDIKKIEDELFKLQQKRGSFYNQTIQTEIETNNTIQDERQKSFEKQNELENKRIFARIQANRRLIAEDKQTYEELQKLQEVHIDKVEQSQDDSFLKTLEKGKKEFEIEYSALSLSLEGRLQLLEDAKNKELALVTETSNAAFLIEKKYAELAFREKVKYLNQYVEASKVGTDILNSYSSLVTQNENFQIKEQEYAKDAQLLNNKNRTQEQIDDETKRANDLISNESLTSEQIERIKFDSETKIRGIQADSANQDLKIQSELDKASIEIRRKQFDREKRIQLVTGAINTAAAILSALGTVQPYPLAIVAAAGAAATGAIQLAAIATKKFDDGGASARSGVEPIKNIDTRPAPSSGGSGLASTNGPGVTGQLLGSGITTNSNGTIKVAVLEGDIRDVMSKVDVLENRATFGV